MSTPSTPHLHLPAGAQFGHRCGPPWRRTTKTLVTLIEEINLSAGLHLLVAPNGSGKTTFLRTIAGLHPILSGQHSIGGRMHYVADELRMDPELTPRALFKAWFTADALPRALELAELLKLDVRCAIGKQSRGNRQKVLIIVAETLAAGPEPSLLLLDEPMTGLDAQTRDIVAAHWAGTPSVLRLVVLHELESVRKADSLLTITQGSLRHTRERRGASWAETCISLC